ncbi:MAG TPA: LEA type 2 family protein [Thermoanaerobaculia bacterium]|nr:LEA type 2 family protein [Thermoanaerobaculia bacterium]
MRARSAAPFATALAAAACLSFRPPTVAFAGVAVSDVTREKATLDVDLAVENPNGYRLGVRRLTYRLSIGGEPAGEGSLDSAVSVPAHGSATVRLPLTLAWAPLRSRALDLALSGGIDYAVEGEVEFTTPLGSRTRPFRHADRVNLFR